MTTLENLNLAKTQTFYLSNLDKFLKKTVLDNEEGYDLLLMTYGDKAIDLYVIGDVDSMGLLAEKGAPSQLTLHDGISKEKLETLFDNVTFASLMIRIDEYTIQFNIFKKDLGNLGSKTKVTCVYESMDELAYALQLLKDYTK